MSRAAIFPIALIISGCATTPDPDAVQAAQCMADVLKMASTVQDVSTGTGYSSPDRQYEPTITYRYLGSDGRSRSVTFGVAKVSTGYAYFWNDAFGGDEANPVARTQAISNAWYDRCKADGILVTM